jgi:AraC-like DNA-binding protein
MVNCAGTLFVRRPFVTNNKSGRLDFYFMYILSGSLDIVNEEKNSLTQGDFVIFPPMHKYKYIHSEEKDLHYIWVHFTGAEASNILNELGILSFPQTYHIDSDITVKQRFQNILDAYSKHDKYRDRELGALLERMLIEIARAINAKETKQANLHVSMNFINSSYTEKINIPQLAKMEHLSTSRYNFLFKKITGTSPSQYILSLRMRSACDLLRNTNLSIKQISVMCGYEDTHFFSKVFKSHIEYSPSAYRNLL